MDKTADTNEWWAGIGGQALGPMTPAELRARWEAGEITLSTLVWRAGFGEWRPAADVPEVMALRPASTPAPSVWQPAAGSALAVLAGAELADLARREGPPRAPSPSGSRELDRMTGASGSKLARNEAVRNAVADEGNHPSPAVAPPAGRTEDAPRKPDSIQATPSQPLASDHAGRRRAALVTGAGTFAMGAAVAVALLLVFRSGDDRIAANETAAAPTRAAAPGSSAAVAAPVAAAPAPAPATAKAPPEPAAQQAGAPASEAPAAARAKGTPDATPDEAHAAVARAPVKDSAAVRTSDPPPSSPPERRAARSATTSRDRQAAKPTAVARRSAQPRKEADSAASRASEPLAMARAPAAAAAPAAPAPEQPKPAARDPLANLVTDADLDRELGGSGGAAQKPAPSAEPTHVATQSPPARRAAEAVYVPPAPGGDLPENVTSVQINEAVRARMASLRSCIDEQRAADPASKGTLKLRWVIGGDGSVKEVRNLSPEYEGKPIARCISGVVREIRFPTSRTPGQEVVFPFKF